MISNFTAILYSMRNTPLYILVAFVLVITSCEDSQQRDLNESNQSTSPKKQSTAKKTADVIYSPNGDCEDFIQSLDFSSLCFTEKTTPEYRVEISGDRNCQYEFNTDNGNGEVHMSIVFSDYGGPEEQEMRKYIFEQVFKQKKKSKIQYTKFTDVKNLGDDAFIGYNENYNEKSLAVRISNVSFTIKIDQTDTDISCLTANNELIKFGQMVIDAIQK